MANHTDWLNISTMSGSSGRTILSLTANTNTQGTDKVAIVKAYNPSLNVSATTTVRLSAYSPYITVSPDFVGIPGSGGTYQMSIQSNCSYNISYPAMVTNYSASSGVGNTSITFTVPSNTAQDTIVGRIVLTDVTSQYSTTVRLEQYAQGVSILYNPTAVTIPYYGGDASFYVSANCAYSISAGSGTWYSVSPQTGYTGETEFVISAPNSNTGNTDWTDSINIVGPEGIAAVLPVTQLNWGQYHFDYTADTSNIAYSGEQRTITLDITDAINSSITIEIVGAPDVTYTYTDSGLTRGIITLTIPQNPGGERNFKVVVTGRRADSQNYATAAIQYTQAALQLDFVTDTSNVRGSGEVRIITILNSNINPNRTGLNLPSDFPRQGSYTVSGNVITLTYPTNPSSSATRTWTIGVLAQTNDGVSLSGSYQITQNANVIYAIPYTADTSTVDVSGETRTITIDTSNLVASSITIGVEGMTGVTHTYNNGIITIVFPENTDGYWKDALVTVTGIDLQENEAISEISFKQSAGPSEYFTIEVLSTSGAKCNIQFLTTSSVSGSHSRTIQYRKNNGEWKNLTSVVPDYGQSQSSATIYVAAGNVIEFKANNASYYTNEYDFNYFCSNGATVNVRGNIMSLTNSTGFSADTTIRKNYAFAYLFTDGLPNGRKLNIRDASGLLLPATNLTEGCYYHMFNHISLNRGPKILPATTLASNCYRYMFNDCYSLITAPELPATTLAPYCYQGMFGYCTSLNYIKCLATNISATSCTDSWVEDVSSSGTFVTPQSTQWRTGTNGIPSGWTRVKA